MDLTGMDVPMLQFYSKSNKPGPRLRLLVSTEYDGINSPRNFTWTELDGKFPSSSNEWTLSDSINLLPYKSHHTYFSWQYVADSVNGASEWTIDDIRFYSAPMSSVQPQVSTATRKMNFNYVSSNASVAKSFYLTGKNLTKNLKLTAPAAFQLSKDSVTYSSTLDFSPAEHKFPLKIFVRFLPPAANSGYGGELIVNFENRDTALLILSGHSTQNQNLFSVVSWDLNSFGIDGGTKVKEEYIKNVLRQLDADVYLVQKVVDTARFVNMVNSLGANYDVLISNQLNSNESPNAFGNANKLAFVYRKNVFSDVKSRTFMQGSAVAKNNWPGGRLPFAFEAIAEKNGIRKVLCFINIDAEFDRDSLWFEKGTAAVNELADSLNASTYNKQHLVVAGNMNDRLVNAIQRDSLTRVSSYKKLVSDSGSFSSISLLLDKMGFHSLLDSTVMLDHMIVSNEMNGDYLPFSVHIADDLGISANAFKDSVSNHYPVVSNYNLQQTTVNLVVPTVTGVTALNNPNRIALIIAGNPASGAITARFSKPLIGSVRIELVNSKGITVVKRSIDASSSISISTTGLAKGWYILKATYGKEVFSSKVIVQ
jgi:hypothetical protein